MTTSTRELRARLDRARPGAEWSTSDLGPVFLLLWIASVARVLVALSRHETFGTIATLSLISIPLLPLLLRREVKRSR